MIKWPNLNLPPINLWNAPRKENPVKRFFDDNGEICSDLSLKEAEQLVHLAFDSFVKAGYLPRDFFQFAEFESSLCLYDWQLDQCLGENK